MRGTFRMNRAGSRDEEAKANRLSCPMHASRPALPLLLLTLSAASCGGNPGDSTTDASASSGGASGGNGGLPGTATGGVPSTSGGTMGGGGDASGSGGGAVGGGGASSGGVGNDSSGGGVSSASGGAASGACEPGTTETTWASSCPTTPTACTPGTWTARPTGSDGHPLRYESEHFALYWHTSDPDGGGPLEGLSSPPSAGAAQAALDTLEQIWDGYFGAPILFPEPYCNSTTKTKAAVHVDDYYPLWGGDWGSGYMGLWIGLGALQDDWGLAHEFMHGVQSTTQGFPDCGGTGCWIYESHANWMPHQIQRDNVHCSEMLINAPHLYYGSTRDRYCNWQFFEFLKDKHCYSAVHDMWAYEAPNGQRDPWQKLMLSQGWDIAQLNDLFGEWAMHNVTFDYRNPEDGSDQGTVYRQNYGSLAEDPGSRTARRLRRTRLEALGDDWTTTRRFVSPYYWAPQRWGYNVVRLDLEPDATEVQVDFRGVTQEGANSDFRWGIVATNAALTEARYSPLVSGSEGNLSLCASEGEVLFLVVTATPSVYQKLPWTQPSDGPAYPSIYRYPYMIEVHGAWPEGFTAAGLADCPSGTVRHENGAGCAPAGTPASVYVGPYARVLGGTVSGTTRIEDQATIVNGSISGGTVGALSLVGVASHPGHAAASFSVSGQAILRGTFYPLGWFGSNQSLGGTAQYLGDLEVYSSAKTAGVFYGLVDDAWSGASSAPEVTTPPPYSWRD